MNIKRKKVARDYWDLDSRLISKYHSALTKIVALQTDANAEAKAIARQALNYETEK